MNQIAIYLDGVDDSPFVQQSGGEGSSTRTNFDQQLVRARRDAGDEFIQDARIDQEVLPEALARSGGGGVRHPRISGQCGGWRA